MAGDNYAQGSSREHAAIAPRYLGQLAVIAKSYARIGFQNMVNYGIIPFMFEKPEDYDSIETRNILEFSNVISSIDKDEPVHVTIRSSNFSFRVRCELTKRQKRVLLDGGLLRYLKASET